MKKLILILFLPIFCVGQNRLDDTDKHFIAGAIISTSSTFVLQALGVKHAPAWGFVTALSVGLLKEVYDHSFHGMKFKDEINEVYYDHVADVFFTGDGGMCATITLFLILQKRNKTTDYLAPVQ